MPGPLASQRRNLNDSSQIGNMAALLSSLFVVFKMSFLPKYRVKYYDYIVNWCSLINCNWCVWLDIAQVLALSIFTLWTFDICFAVHLGSVCVL